LKPRLLIILNRLATGGPASNTLALAEAMHQHFEILLIAGNPLPEEQSAAYLLDKYQGFETRIIPDFKRTLSPFRDFLTYKKIVRIIREFKPEIVHTHGSKPGLLGRLAASRCKVPLIVHTYHGHVFKSYFSHFISQLIIRTERVLAKKSHVLIAINRQLRKELIEVYKIAAASKVYLNRLGIDAVYFQNVNAEFREQFRREFLLNDDVVVVAIVGRLVKIKNHRLFIDIAKRLLQEHSDHYRYVFFVIGDGEEYESLETYAQNSGLRLLRKNQSADKEFDIAFTSWRKDIDKVMAGIDILLMTSLNEGTPVAILEAMSAGKPIVSTPVGGIPELLNEAECGATADNENEIVQQIRLFAESPTQRILKGEQGKNYVKMNLSVENQAKELTRTLLERLHSFQTAHIQ
jgi:glycosyltransferase involved in cell wall biosynthesis